MFVDFICLINFRVMWLWVIWWDRNSVSSCSLWCQPYTEFLLQAMMINSSPSSSTVVPEVIYISLLGRWTTLKFFFDWLVDWLIKFIYVDVRGEESSDSTGPIFIPRRRRAGAPSRTAACCPPATGNENWARGVARFFPPYSVTTRCHRTTQVHTPQARA